MGRRSLTCTRAPATFASWHPRASSPLRCVPTLCAARATMAATLLATWLLSSDNEIVLNSAKVGLVLKDFDMYHTNSCEYEPWKNPTERNMRIRCRSPCA
eukprot:6202553-Pleurochrysis_carterae.AAC.5